MSVDAWAAHWSHYASWSRLLPRRNLIPTSVIEFSGSDDENNNNNEHNQLATWRLLEYLRSDETRLPSHSAFESARPPRDSDFDTLMTAQDEARRTGTTYANSNGGERRADEPEDGSSTPLPGPPPPGFDEDIELLERRVAAVQDPASRLTDPDYGVVVGGAFGTLDDATWATMNGTLRAVDVKDVMCVLRCSGSLQRDLARQLQLQQSLSDLAGKGHRVQLRLSRYLEHHPGTCFRVFVEDGKAVAMSQRAVDQVFSSLAGMDEAEHERLFDTLRKPVEQHLVCGIRRGTVAVLDSPSANHDSTRCAAELAALRRWAEAPCLTVDIVYEGGTLPVIVCGVRCVPSLATVASGAEAATERAARCAAELDTMDGTGGGGGTDHTTNRVCLTATPDPLAFRLFRSYERMKEFADRRRQDDTRQVAVARSHDDLFGDGKQFAGGTGGLPVELQHPELFQADAEMQAFLKRVMEDQQRQ